MSNKIVITKDGSHSILSEQFGVTYHSIHGAIQETQHVFLDAGLHYKSEHQNDISILEIGFGTGLNAYMTLLDIQDSDLKIKYTSTEAYPISLEQAEALNYHQELKQDNSDSFLQLHQSNWEENIQLTSNFNFTKHKMLFEDIQFKNQFDVIYFDAFAPNAQSIFWEEPFLIQMFDSLKENGILVTYCAKGSFKRALKAVGFQVEAIPGPPGKREMTRAIKSMEV